MGSMLYRRGSREIPGPLLSLENIRRRLSLQGGQEEDPGTLVSEFQLPEL